MVQSKFSTYLIARADRRLTGSWKEEKTEQRIKGEKKTENNVILEASMNVGSHYTLILCYRIHAEELHLSRDI